MMGQKLYVDASVTLKLSGRNRVRCGGVVRTQLI